MLSVKSFSSYTFHLLDLLQPALSQLQRASENPRMFVSVLQADFKLMCDNAMTYNRPDTVYYKLAKKILHTGFKMMSKVRQL